MLQCYAQQIRDRIDTASDNTIFITADFSDIADSKTVRGVLARLVQKGALRRVLPGIYHKPRFSTFLNEYMPANPEEVAHAIARRNGWIIGPTGYTGLNLLGLSTQVPMTWSFVSSGPTTTYSWGKTTLYLIHEPGRDISESYITTLVIQALKVRGKQPLTEKEIHCIRSRIRPDYKTVMPEVLREAVHCTKWVYDMIQQIAADSPSGSLP